MTEIERTVFIIDDDEAIRKLVATIVGNLGVRSEEFASAEQFLASRRAGQRGCIVLDVRLAGMNGLQLQQRIRDAGEALPVVVITGHADVPMAVQAMQQGAASFLEKPFSGAELRSAVEQALAAEERSHVAMAERLQIQQRIDLLTENERSVFALLIEGRANKAIAATLKLGMRTVETRRASIMKKMQAESLPELVRMAICAEWKNS